MTSEPISDPICRTARPSLPTLTAEQFAELRKVRAAKVEGWKTLGLRQTFADEEHMRGFLTRYGVRIASSLEPATPGRLAKILRRGRVYGEQWTEAIGCSLPEFLDKNPNLPLWAATALVLESTT